MKENSMVINEFYERTFIFVFFFFILAPLFINLDFSNGINFDANYFNQYNRPSIPLSLIIVVILSLYYIKEIFFDKKMIWIVIYLSIFTSMNLYFGITRSIVVFLGSMIPIVTYKACNYFFEKYSKFNLITIFYYSIVSFIFIKMCFDIKIYFEYINIERYYPGMQTQLFFIDTPFFMSDKIAIYNYYDYFPHCLLYCYFTFINKSIK